MKITLGDLRRKRKMTQQQLADALGYKLSTIGMYEVGLRRPPLDKAIEIADFFNEDVKNIFFGKFSHRTRRTNK